LPPVVTRRKSFRLSGPDQPAPLAPPYIAGSRPLSEEPPQGDLHAPEPATANEEIAEDMPWDSMSDESNEGVVEPAFKADTDAVLEELTQHAAEMGNREDFPLEAFIVPEQSERLPNGMEGRPLPPAPENTPITSLAERLEKLSHRLRVDETEMIIRRLAEGDRLDTLLAGLLAGYLAGSSDHS
jgi:hypothetical protein